MPSGNTIYPPAQVITGTIASNLSDKQFTFVKKTSADPQVWEAATSEVDYALPLQDKGVNGSSVLEEVPLPAIGFAFITLGEELAHGVKIKPGSGGKAVAAGPGDSYVGILDVGGVANDVVPYRIEFGAVAAS